MKDFSDSDKRALRQGPEFRSLLDQLETKIEHDLASPGDLNVLSLRLFALHRQRDRLGRSATISAQEPTSSEASADRTSKSTVTSKLKTADLAPSTVPNNKFQLWLSRRRNS